MADAERPFDLRQMIADVEQYVELPPGSIRPFLSSEEHWVFVLKTCSMVETILKSAIFLRVIPGSVPFGGLGGVPMSFEQAKHAGLRKHLSRIPLRGDAG